METKENKKTGLIVFISVTLLILLVGGILLYTLVFSKMNNTNSNTSNNEQETIDPVDDKREKITPLMYEITKEGSNNKIYLIGSIHFADIPSIKFPKYVDDAYNNSDYLACEFDILKAIETIDSSELTKDYFYTYPDSLENHVSKDTYNKIIKFMADKFKYNEDKVKVMSLTYIESTITQLVIADSNIHSGDGVDTYFLKKAHADNKNILEVETYEFQTKLTNSFPDRVTELSILDMIENYDLAVSELNKLYDTWKYGNVQELSKLLLDIKDKDNYTKEDLDLMIDYNKKMLDDRNIGMKNKLEEYFDKNYKVFYMVGAGHLIGENGIASLLEKDGYTVKIIKG